MTKRRLTPWREYFARRYGDQSEVDASRFIAHLSTRKHKRIFLLARVSTSKQNVTKNARDQIRWMRHEAELRGFEVVGHQRAVTNGSLRDDTIHFELAAKRARELGAVLVAESVDRFIRSPFYHPSEESDTMARLGDFERLKTITGDLKLATFLKPDLHWTKVRGHQSKRGQTEKGKKGGRPVIKRAGYKKQRRLKKKGGVVALKKAGHSLREIEQITGVSRATAGRWC